MKAFILDRYGSADCVRAGEMPDPELREDDVLVQDWTRLATAAAEFGRVVALDMPGFGRADNPPGFDYTVRGYARTLRVPSPRSTSAGRTSCFTTSEGRGGSRGPQRIRTSSRRPRSSTPACSEGIGGIISRESGALLCWARLFQAAATRWSFQLLLRHGNPRGLPREFVDQMFDDYDRGTRRAVLKLYRATSEPGQMSEDLMRALRPLARPALVVWGTHDPYIPVDYAERQREVFPGAEVIVLEQSGHWPFADDPIAVAQTVLPFLRAQLRR